MNRTIAGAALAGLLAAGAAADTRVWVESSGTMILPDREPGSMREIRRRERLRPDQHRRTRSIRRTGGNNEAEWQ